MFVKLLPTHRSCYAYLVESYRRAHGRHPFQRYLMNLGKMSRGEARLLRDLVRQSERLESMAEVLADYREEGDTAIGNYPIRLHFQGRIGVRRGGRGIGSGRR